MPFTFLKHFDGEEDNSFANSPQLRKGITLLPRLQFRVSFMRSSWLKFDRYAICHTERVHNLGLAGKDALNANSEGVR